MKWNYGRFKLRKTYQKSVALDIVRKIPATLEFVCDNSNVSNTPPIAHDRVERDHQNDLVEVNHKPMNSKNNVNQWSVKHKMRIENQ